MTDFSKEVEARVKANGSDEELTKATRDLLLSSIKAKYSYNFSWLSRPIIQYPQDIVAVQELIWQIQPDLIIETGIAHGGSLILSASMLAMLDYAEAVERKEAFNPHESKRCVLGLDIDIREHNRAAIEAHPMSHLIQMIQGSSIAPEIVEQVKEKAKGYKKVMVMLDSNHTHDHVLEELEAYAPLTSQDSYCIVFDTVVEDLPKGPDRPWGPGDNPKTAVWEYLRRLKEEGRQAADGQSLQLAVDEHTENKILLTVAPNGYLKRV